MDKLNELQLTIYMVQFITTQFKQLILVVR